MEDTELDNDEQEKKRIAEQLEAELGDAIDDTDMALIDMWAFELNI